jgi:condensin complex subunit 2
LFKKTSADFDEGGAGGILMNHLGVDGRMKVVFDAGEGRVGDDEDEDESEEEEEYVKVDLSRLIR